jgi:hypothetical protein
LSQDEEKTIPSFFIALSGYDGESFVVLMSGFALEEKKIW